MTVPAIGPLASTSSAIVRHEILAYDVAGVFSFLVMHHLVFITKVTGVAFNPLVLFRTWLGNFIMHFLFVHIPTFVSGTVWILIASFL